MTPSASHDPNPESRWFGDTQVTPEEKTARVRGVFDSVAEKYDLMNDLMSGGLHRLWKDHFVRRIRPRAGMALLDVAGGTGDIAFRLHRKITAQRSTTPTPPITVFDLNPHMLEVGRDRAANQGWLSEFEWITGNAEDLPFPDNSFDIYTIAFGLRNVTHIDKALAEAHRVLKSGGRFFCLEFSHVENPVLAKAYDLYSTHIIPTVGGLVTHDRNSYQYLVESIRKFPAQAELVGRLAQAGFRNAGVSNLSGGIVALHTGTKDSL